MSTIILPLLAAAPGAVPPQLTFVNARPRLAFDASTDEYVVFTFRLPDDYSSAAALKVQWSGSTSTTTSHTAVWGAEIMALTPETDSVATDSDSYDTINTVSDDILGTTAKRPQECEITLTNNDSMAAGDYISLRFRRDADNGSDDLTEDAWLWALSFVYTAS